MKREYRNMSLKALVQYAADELEDIAERGYANDIFTKGRRKEIQDLAAVLREKAP